VIPRPGTFAPTAEQLRDLNKRLAESTRKLIASDDALQANLERESVTGLIARLSADNRRAEDRRGRKGGSR
jgi:hypothetical protein